MTDMEIPILLRIGSEEREIVARVRYEITPGRPAHYGSPTYPGHPAEPPEIEIGNVLTLCAAGNRLNAYDIMPAGAIRNAIEDMAVQYIAEHHEDTGHD
ncbi:hypothetical protein ACFOGJ_16025 [Marinibaculum pumilum]|uniref:Uncharacterized protein n=1 Tax=Marinibaculum pumilum TaxID=1766165 RepID=A0ABV7L385_9PROT